MLPNAQPRPRPACFDKRDQQRAKLNLQRSLFGPRELPKHVHIVAPARQR